LLFDCRFDEESDEYSTHYDVFLLPEMKEEDVPDDWTNLSRKDIKPLGRKPTANVHFDPTRRQSIRTETLELFEAKLSE